MVHVTRKEHYVEREKKENYKGKDERFKSIHGEQNMEVWRRGKNV